MAREDDFNMDGLLSPHHHLQCFTCAFNVVHDKSSLTLELYHRHRKARAQRRGLVLRWHPLLGDI
jgi:hypothetical protein